MLILLDEIRTVILDNKIVPELVENLKPENLEHTNTSKVREKSSRNLEHTHTSKVREKSSRNLEHTHTHSSREKNLRNLELSKVLEKSSRTLCELARHGNSL
jgi:hypothetical protein